MRNPKIIIALLLAVVAGGSAYRLVFHRNLKPANVVEYESDATEGLLRGIFQELRTGSTSAYFLAFGERLTAPSPAFISRFSAHKPPVRSFTASTFSPLGNNLEASSGKVGVIIQITSIKEVIPAVFDFEVEFSNLPGGHNRFVYRLVQEGGEWKIRSRSFRPG